jgi:hypothetical protein
MVQWTTFRSIATYHDVDQVVALGLEDGEAEEHLVVGGAGIHLLHEAFLLVGERRGEVRLGVRDAAVERTYLRPGRQRELEASRQRAGQQTRAQQQRRRKGQEAAHGRWGVAEDTKQRIPEVRQIVAATLEQLKKQSLALEDLPESEKGI